ncbi:PREDICTED: uncharacterized protein LOC109206146 [Nicotiana attenuata]|uniref:uncharacterized protein LOC109206146 n=1 Tax=Nicotiana attenuata TaxID=49451 RepID=UPI000904B749|nr:PREDICTED: uncharacterized protein LOC109206146 [Nicotiana attenuata]
MARGRGRGRGRPKKIVITSSERPTTTHSKPTEKETDLQTPDLELNSDTRAQWRNTGGVSSSGVSKKLDLTTPPASASKVQLEEKTKDQGLHATVANATVTIAEEEQGVMKPALVTKEVGPKTWSNLFQKNRSAANGMSLSYIPPEIVNGQVIVQLDKEEVESETEKWKCALIVYILGDTPGYNTMKRYINVNWASVRELDVFLHEEGYYIIRFHSKADMKEIYYSGPYTINNRPIILKPWTAEIASAVGTPIFADECTTKKTRISYARMLIEVNVTRPLKEEIWVRDPKGKQFLQDVYYEWKPKFCEQCQKVGHSCAPHGTGTKQDGKQQINQKGKAREAKKVTMEWRTKGKVQQNDTQSVQSIPVEQQMQQQATEVQQKAIISAKSRPESSQGQYETAPPSSPSKVILSNHNRGKQVECSPEFNLTNFPLLSTVKLRNPFEGRRTPNMLTNWLFWNVRGVNKRYKQKELANYIKSKNVKIAGLMETRVKEHNFKRVTKAIAPDWEGINNYQYAQNGRVWVLWDPRWYSVKLLKAGDQYVHCQITDNVGKIDCLITVVYGHNTIEQRKALWAEVHKMAANITTPWLIGGDFNAVLYSQDRLMGNPITYAETQDFANCIQTLQLSELLWKGDYYTWSNKQDGTDRIRSRIDRMFGNFEWMMQWGQVLQIVQEVWEQNVTKWRMQNIWLKLKTLKARLKTLNNEECRSIAYKIDRARGEPQEIQERIITNYTDGLLEQEKNALHQMEKWSLIQESVLKQKSRARWIKLGDSNSKYFSAMLKERNQRKQIKELTALDGQKLNDADKIKHEIIEFYKSLMGTAATNLPSINREIMKQGPVLSQQQRRQLVAEISDQEIFEGLQNIGEDKASGIDGYNACFFKKTWPVIKVEICEAVKEFFSTGRLYKALNALPAH